MKHFQIVLKGIASNKISIMETTDYIYYKERLKYYSENPLCVVITTNIYIVE